MIIEIPGHKFRVKGCEADWQVQYPNGTAKDGSQAWAGRYFFPSLEHAMGKAYELVLLESPEAAGFADVPAECRRVKDELIAAVRRAAKQ